MVIRNGLYVCQLNARLSGALADLYSVVTCKGLRQPAANVQLAEGRHAYGSGRPRPASHMM